MCDDRACRVTGTSIAINMMARFTRPDGFVPVVVSNYTLDQLSPPDPDQLTSFFTYLTPTADVNTAALSLATLQRTVSLEGQATMQIGGSFTAYTTLVADIGGPAAYIFVYSKMEYENREEYVRLDYLCTSAAALCGVRCGLCPFAVLPPMVR
jgi:hypothetical protein